MREALGGEFKRRVAYYAAPIVGENLRAFNLIGGLLARDLTAVPQLRILPPAEPHGVMFMKYVIAIAVSAIALTIATGASASTASQREYKRGYADCAAGKWDGNQHGESYKKGCRAAEDKSGAAGGAAPAAEGSSATQPAPHKLTKNDQACIRAVKKQTRNSKVAYISSETSQANDSVIVGVGPQRAQWRCLVSGGKVSDVQSMTDEGKL